MSPELVTHVNHLRYRERLHLSYQDFLNEPIEEIAFAFAVWSQEDKRDKLSVARQQQAS